MKRFAFPLVFLCLLNCRPLLPEQGYFVPEHLGRVYVYLQPVPSEAPGIRIKIGSISVVHDDGSVIPLSLSRKDWPGSRLAGFQRLAATGGIPPGTYAGLSVKIDEASIRGEHGRAELLVPEPSVFVEHRFHGERGKPIPLFLSFHSSRSTADGFLFRPAFSLAGPRRELANLTGYLTDPASDTVTVFNKKTVQVVDAIGTGSAPMGIVLDQKERQAYVAVSGDDAIEVIDLERGEVTNRVTITPGDRPIALALSPDGRTLLSVNSGSDSVSIIDTSSRAEVERIKVGDGPVWAAVDRRGLRAYVVDSLSSTLSVVDLPNRGLVATIPVEGTPLRGAFNRDGTMFYVISRNAPHLLVVDTINQTVTKKIFVGQGAVSIRVDTRTDLVYVGNEVSQGVQVIDPTSLLPLDRIEVGGVPSSLAIDGEERTLFVLSADRKTIRKVNIVSREIIGEMDVEKGAYEISIMGEL